MSLRRVTAIERQPRRRRANVSIDGRFALALSLEVLAGSGLRLGDELTQARLEELRQAEARHAALTSALRLLSYRPRSEAEMRQRLARRGVPHPIVDETVARLRDLGLVDDEAFAGAWVESRDRSSPRGRRLLASELSARGVARQTVRRSLAGLDEGDAAYRAAGRRARSLAALPYADFRRRLGDFLLRRGFGYETVASTVARLWKEMAAHPSGDEEGATEAE